MIEFKHVSKHYGPQDILIDANIRILSGDRLGVVGPNGAGKTTLFTLITGTSSPDKGDVLVQAGIRIGHLRQVLDNREVKMGLTDYVADAIPELKDAESRLHELEDRLHADPSARSRAAWLREHGELQSRFEQLGGYTLRARAEAALGGLGFATDRLAEPLSTFSGGWQMRAELARVLIAAPDLLLLDEPSNYLDLPAVEWLQRFLRSFQGTLVLISHDRYLLNTLTRDTLEINAGRCTLYSGPYDEYMRQRIARHEQLLAQHKNQEQKRKQVERFIERFRAKNTKATQVQSRIKMLEKMEQVELPDQLMTRGRIRLAPPPHCGTEIMRLEKAAVKYDDAHWVLHDVNLSILRGEKIALVGMNGLGKTTLLRALAGVLPISEGRRMVGHQVVTGYQTQDFAESMRPGDTVFQAVRERAPDINEREIRTLLGGFGFSGDTIEKPVSILSGGEKIRLAFARLLVKPPNLLLLDEPTTHLDVHAREALEDALISYTGTLVFVSHDVEFVRRVAKGIIAMEPPGIRAYMGGYDDYLRKISSQSAAEDEMPPDIASTPATRKAQKRERALKVQANAARRRKLEKIMRKAEADLERLEEEQRNLASHMESGGRTLTYAEINQRLTELPARIEDATKTWEDAALEIESLQIPEP